MPPSDPPSDPPWVPLAVPAHDHRPRTGLRRLIRRVGGACPDRGQTTVLVSLVVGVALLVLVALTHLGTAVIDRAQARTAADAAALAGVVEELQGDGAGRRSATDVATENGATLIAYAVDGATVEVTVRVDDAYATSRAERVVDAGA